MHPFTTVGFFFHLGSISILVEYKGRVIIYDGGGTPEENDILEEIFQDPLGVWTKCFAALLSASWTFCNGTVPGGTTAGYMIAWKRPSIDAPPAYMS